MHGPVHRAGDSESRGGVVIIGSVCSHSQTKCDVCGTCCVVQRRHTLEIKTKYCKSSNLQYYLQFIMIKSEILYNYWYLILEQTIDPNIFPEMQGTAQYDLAEGNRSY